MWRSRRSGNTTAWSSGLNTKHGAIHAAGSEAIAMIQLGTGTQLTKEERATVRANVKAAIIVVEA